MSDWEKDPKFIQWAEHVRDEVIPKISESDIGVSIAPPTDKVDVKFAVELGLMIMLDKPIMAVVKPGQVVPRKLALVCERVVVADITTRAGREALAEAIREFAEEHP